MKKTLILLLSLISYVNVNAQIVSLYKGDSLVCKYNSSQIDKIIFDEETEEQQTHEYVDLGLPSGTLWATCNVGAEKPEDYGLYFAWGETVGYTSNALDEHSFDELDYKWCNNSIYANTKYCTSNDYGTIDNIIELEADDDAATSNWGNEWETPSKSQLEELVNNCTWTWDSTNKGYNVSSQTNSNSIFLPAAGCCSESVFRNYGDFGYYRSRNLDTDVNYKAYSLRFFFINTDVKVYSDGRDAGTSIRPVRVDKINH